MEYLEKAAKQAKQVVKQARYQMEGLTEVEILARECTNSDPWYAGGTDLAELARASRDREDMYLIMKTLWARLDGRDDQWRNVYKAITAFEYLVANGAEEVVRELRAGQRAIERLENFHFKDERGRDQGINVRQGSQRLVALINDPSKIAEVRDKAIQNRGKYGGISSSDARGASFSRAGSSSQSRSGVSVAAPPAPSGYAAPAPPPARQQRQHQHQRPDQTPSFASFPDDKEDDSGDDRDDDADIGGPPRRGFVPKIQMSAAAATSAAPASAAPIAPPPGGAPAYYGAPPDVFGDFAAAAAGPTSASRRDAALDDLLGVGVVGGGVGGGSSSSASAAPAAGEASGADPFGAFVAAATPVGNQPAPGIQAPPGNPSGQFAAPDLLGGGFGGGRAMGDGFAPGIPRGPDPADPFGASMAFAAVEPAAVHARAAVKKPPGAGAGAGAAGPSPASRQKIGHARRSSAGSDALEGLTADFLSMGGGMRGAGGLANKGGGLANSAGRGAPMRSAAGPAAMGTMGGGVGGMNGNAAMGGGGGGGFPAGGSLL